MADPRCDICGKVRLPDGRCRTQEACDQLRSPHLRARRLRAAERARIRAAELAARPEGCREAVTPIGAKLDMRRIIDGNALADQARRAAERRGGR